jgi:hypothetical protein
LFLDDQIFIVCSDHSLVSKANEGDDDRPCNAEIVDENMDVHGASPRLATPFLRSVRDSKLSTATRALHVALPA